VAQHSSSVRFQFALCAVIGTRLPARPRPGPKQLSAEFSRFCDCRRSSISSYSCWCESLQEKAGMILESLDQKTRGFVVQIVLPR
jgi:hypothetical protein